MILSVIFILNFGKSKEDFVGYVNSSYIDNPPLVINNKVVTISYGGDVINSANYTNLYKLTSDKKLGIVDSNNMVLSTYEDVNIFVGNSDKVNLLQEWIILTRDPVNLTSPVQIKSKNKEIYLSCSDNNVVFTSKNVSKNSFWNIIKNNENENGFFYIQNASTKKYLNYKPSIDTSYISPNNYLLGKKPDYVPLGIVYTSDKKVPWFIAPELPIFSSGKGTYENSYEDAKKYCESKNKRLCSLNELNSYANLGLSVCANSWTMTKDKSDKPISGYPMAKNTSGCGNKGLNIWGDVSGADILCCPTQQSGNPCFTSSYNTGPHSEKCINLLWKKYGCSLEGLEYIKNETDIYKKWMRMSIPDIEKNMQEINKNVDNSKCSKNDLLPGGDWKNDKRTLKSAMITDDNLLTAELKDDNGNYKKKSIKFSFGEEFSNVNGFFSCTNNCKVIFGKISKNKRNFYTLQFEKLSGKINYSLEVSKDRGNRWTQFAKYNLANCGNNKYNCEPPIITDSKIIKIIQSDDQENWSCCNSDGGCSVTDNAGMFDCKGQILIETNQTSDIDGYVMNDTINDFLFKAVPITISNGKKSDCRDCESYMKCFGNPFTIKNQLGKEKCLKQLWNSYGCTKEGTQYPDDINNNKSIFKDKNYEQSKVLIQDLYKNNLPKADFNYDYNKIEQCQGKKKVNELKRKEDEAINNYFINQCNDKNQFINFSSVNLTNTSYNNKDNCKKKTFKEDWDGYLMNGDYNCINYNLNDDNISTYNCGKSFPDGRFYGEVKKNIVNKKNFKNLEEVNKNYENLDCKDKTYFSLTHSNFYSYNTETDENNCRTLCTLDPFCDSYLMSDSNTCNLINLDKNKSKATYDCKPFNGGKMYGNIKKNILHRNRITKYDINSVKFNKNYNIIDSWVKTLLGWCGKSGCGLGLGTYPKSSDYYNKNKESCEWYFVPKDNNSDTKPIKYGDVFSIRSKKNGYFLVTCDSNYCGSSAYLSVSVNKYNGPSNIFAGNAQYWKFESLDGKDGYVNLKDKFRLINLWGSNSSLNTCWHYNCGGTYYDGFGVNTAKINSPNYLGYSSKWLIEAVKDYVEGEIRNGRGLYFFGLTKNKKLNFQVSKDGINWTDFAYFNTNTGKPSGIDNPFITLGGWWSCTPNTGNCSGVIYAKSGKQTDYKYRAIISK